MPIRFYVSLHAANHQPVYVLMASIDFMRETMEREGRVLYSSLYDRLSRFYERLSHFKAYIGFAYLPVITP
jgi:arginine/lysine/ornithine decarboxylase